MTVEHITRYSLCMCPTLRHGPRLDHWPKLCVPASLEASSSQSFSGICTDAHPSVECVLPCSHKWQWRGWALSVIPRSCNCSPCHPSSGRAARQEQTAANFHTNPLPPEACTTPLLWCLLACSAENRAMPHAISSLCCAVWATVFPESES